MPDALATVIVVAILIVIEAIVIALLFDHQAVLRAGRRVAESVIPPLRKAS